MRKLLAAVLGCAALVSTGCFDIEQSLTLERNLSGRAGFRMKVDLEGMALVMAQMQRSMSGKEGPATAAEIEAAKKEMLKDDKPMDPAEFAKGKKELEAKLPKGVTLIDATFEEKGLAMLMNFVFGFDHPSKLSQITFPDEKPAGGGDPGFAAAGPGSGNPVDSPFGGLKVTDEGATILVTSPPQNPMADAMKDGPPPVPDAETKKLVDGMFKSLRVAFKITSPLAIVEQNAHRREGNTLIWEYTLASLEKMKPEQLQQSIRVRYRK
jgi:hypothetical protein